MFTKLFKDLSKDSVDIAGGKGASLGEMTQAGIPVPSGFVVLSGAFEQFLKEADLNVEMDSILHYVDHNKMHTVEEASEKIQSLILNSEMPEDISKEVEKSFKELDTEFVAVRSSATSEDSASAAWAGQLDSFLNTNKETLIDNVKKCWASLFTPRAIFYRFEKELHATDISVAVVVQKMVESEVSGVAFSVHPVTEDYNQLIIEASFGLGESIVSGQVTPDSYVVEKDPRRIIDINVATQNKALYRKEGGSNEWKDIEENEGEKQVLTGEQISDLAEIIIEVEGHYGFPCDIEWAYAKGEFYIVQSRPITTLKESPNIHKEEENNKIEYEEHQRDYTLIGNSATFTFLIEEKLTKYFSYQAEPMYLCKEDGLFFHYYAVKDKVERAKKWYEKFDIEELKDQRKKLKKLLKEIRNFYDSDHNNLLESIKRLYEYYGKILPISLIITEVPEYNDVSEYFLDICFELRKASEFVYKEGESLGKELIKKAEKELELSKGTLEDMTYREFLSFYKNKELPEKIEKRKDFVLVEINKDKDVFYYERDKLNKIYIPKNESDSEISGTTAYKGNVMGKVKIITKLSDANKINKGDILVASMTDPRYMSAMKKASAFITDEGGVTCHAAIVAREMKKPCIIGTKFATQVLKDGNEVEVDADNGVVRVLDKK